MIIQNSRGKGSGPGYSEFGGAEGSRKMEKILISEFREGGGGRVYSQFGEG